MTTNNTTGNPETPTSAESGVTASAPRPGLFDDADVISTYTREQAIEDGVLVDVSETAREAGFTIPVAVTSAVWADYVTPDPRSVPYGQSVEGRLWDVLWMARCYIRRAQPGQPEILFQVIFIMKERQRRVITLKAVCGPGDNAEPAITIMPHEDCAAPPGGASAPPGVASSCGWSMVGRDHRSERTSLATEALPVTETSGPSRLARRTPRSRGPVHAARPPGNDELHVGTGPRAPAGRRAQRPSPNSSLVPTTAAKPPARP